MKNINKLALILSLLTLLIACSVLNMSSLPKEYRYTWAGMNPWNGVEGIAFTVSYFLHTGIAATYVITIGLVLMIWWRMYALFNRFLP